MTSRALVCGVMIALAALASEEVEADFLQPVGKLSKRVTSFEWVGDRLYSWDGRTFQIFDVTDWSDIKTMGDVSVGEPVSIQRPNRIQTVGSRAYLYVDDPVWMLNPDNTITGPSKYRTVIDLRDPMSPVAEGDVDFGSLDFATLGNVAVGSFLLEGSTVLELADSGELLERSKLTEFGIPTIVDQRVYLFNEGSINVADITNVEQPVMTTMRSEASRDYSFSDPLFWGDYMAETEHRGSELRIWDVKEPGVARQIATLELDATSVTPLGVVYPTLFVEIGKSGSASLAAIDISDLEAPLLVGQSDLSSGIEEFQVVGSRAVIQLAGQINFYEIASLRVSDFAYSRWQEETFESEDLGEPMVEPEADPDRDGISNRMEFALGSKPLRADPFPLTLIEREAKSFVSYSRLTHAAPWFDYILETSATLAPGSWSPVQEARVSQLFARETYEAEIPDGQTFARLRVVGK